MISAKHLQNLAGFAVRSLVQDIGRFGVDLHSYTNYQLQTSGLI